MCVTLYLFVNVCSCALLGGFFLQCRQNGTVSHCMSLFVVVCHCVTLGYGVTGCHYLLCVTMCDHVSPCVTMCVTVCCWISQWFTPAVCDVVWVFVAVCGCSGLLWLCSPRDTICHSVLV